MDDPCGEIGPSRSSFTTASDSPGRSVSSLSGSLDVDHTWTKGISMVPVTACRPVQIKLGVDDVDGAVDLLPAGVRLPLRRDTAH